jgi:NitT/TauT family transport system substrate-binding protein
VNGGKELDDIIKMIRKHIPMHTPEAIKQSLRADIMAINYKNLNVDTNSKESFSRIMDLAYEGGFIKEKIDIESLSNAEFTTDLTVDRE